MNYEGNINNYNNTFSSKKREANTKIREYKKSITYFINPILEDIYPKVKVPKKR